MKPLGSPRHFHSAMAGCKDGKSQIVEKVESRKQKAEMWKRGSGRRPSVERGAPVTDRRWVRSPLRGLIFSQGSGLTINRTPPTGVFLVMRTEGNLPGG